LEALKKQAISIKNEVFNLVIVECLDCNSADFLDTEFENGFKYPFCSLVFFTRNQVESFLLFHRNATLFYSDFSNLRLFRNTLVAPVKVYYDGEKMRIMTVPFVLLFRKGQMGKLSLSTITKCNIILTCSFSCYFV
jgi:hypothetical protein